MSAAEADRWAWLLVLSFVFGCNVLRILLPSFSSFMSRVLQKDAEQESQMRAEIQDMKQELSTVNMMDEFARYARLERRINKMTDKLKTHVKARTAQLAKIKWVISVAFYILQGGLGAWGLRWEQRSSTSGFLRWWSLWPLLAPWCAAVSETVSCLGGPDGLAHLEVLLCACGCGADQVDHSARPPGSLPYESGRWCWDYLLDFSL
uniref:Guided entry of tail-anchored proteins factor 1 n=1 Tax=Equus caballus TaxID=9796 RepID=A0A9L0R9P4_HORSE